MRVLVCKRGGTGPRNKTGHCLCDACTAFNRARHRRNNLVRAEQKKEWIKKNPDRVKEYSKKWKAANKEKRRNIERSWRDKNPDKVKAMNAKAGAKWSKTSAGKRNALTRKRVALKLQRTPVWADLEAIQVFYIEAARLTTGTGIPHEVDHIYPLQGKFVSGLHVETNLQIITRTQNRSKHNRTALTWDSAY
jgi:hypothetical protein